MEKSADAFRTISEVAADLDLPQHVLRFWETRFPQIKPLKRAGGRRYYRPQDIELLRGIKHLLYGEGFTIKGVQRILKEQGARAVKAAPESEPAAAALPLPMLGQAEYEPEGQRPETVEPPVPFGVAEGAPEWPAEPLRQAVSLSAGDVERLREVLAELVRCGEILSAARRA